MAKFNKLAESPVKTVNLQGFPAYKLGDEATLTSQVLTTFFGEPKFYKPDDSGDIIKLATAVAQKDPQFVANLAVYARSVFNMRSVSHVLTAIVAKVYKEELHEAKSGPDRRGLVRKLVNSVVIRPDDMTEIVACYFGLFGKPLPQGLKRGVADVLNRTDSYGLAKYRGNGHDVKMKDLINLCHPRPKDKEQEALFKQCLEDKLETPVTWETKLSAEGNRKEVWEELIDGKHIGFMASLRNLRNLIQAGVSDKHLNVILAKLSDKNEVLRSRQLPFRFLSAYKELQEVDGASSKVFDALETALEYSVENLPKFDGRTAVLVDVSGSMDSAVSAKSKMTCAEIGLMLGIMAARLSPDTVFLTFDTQVYPQAVSTKSGILSQVRNIQVQGGGTAIYKPIEYLADKKIKVDRIILLSDNEANVFNASYYTVESTRLGYFNRNAIKQGSAQVWVNLYRRDVNENVWIHAVDLQGYGTTQFNPHDKRVNYIAGWSEKLLQFIQLAESGVTTLVDTVRKFEMSSVRKEEQEAA